MHDYTAILKEELIPAMGCTEPIAIALCAARARELLGRDPERMTVWCSSNVIKNARCVTVPGTGGMTGIAAAAAAGCFGGRADRLLEVIGDLSGEALAAARAFEQSGSVSLRHQQGVDNLYIRVRVEAGADSAEAQIEGEHTRFTGLSRNDLPLPLPVPRPEEEVGEAVPPFDLEDMLRYVQAPDFDQDGALRALLDGQARQNLAIAQEGLSGHYGAEVGRTILRSSPDRLRDRLRAHAAAGSDARMAGCALPVVINSGSGNQGITVSLPLVVYAREKAVPDDRLRRALALSNLIAIQMKRRIGRLSAFCGVVSAAAAAGAGLAWLEGMDSEQVGQVISISLLTAGGVVCDGAKASCASKIALALDSALLALDLVRAGQRLPAGQGLDGRSVESTIDNIARVAREGMQETDCLILDTMLRGCPPEGPCRG